MLDRGSILNALSPEERGCLLGACLLSLGDAVCGFFPVVSQAWAALRGMTKAERAALLAVWIAEMHAPFPPGMDRLHPSWVAEILSSQPEHLWPALIIGLPNAGPVRERLSNKNIPEGTEQGWRSEAVVELQRYVFASLAPLCRVPSGPLGAYLCRLSFEELLAEIDRRGAGGAEGQRATGLAALREELSGEGIDSMRAVAGRLPATIGRSWL